MAVSETHLISSVGLIEKDVNADTLWVWCFPAVSSELREVLMRKCCLSRDSPELHAFVFGQYRRSWYYLSTTEVQEPTALNKVTHFSIVITAKDFNPEKYAAFSRVLCRIYMKHGSPVKMMECYIAVLIKGICQSDENGSFLIKDYDVRKAYLAGSIKDVVSQFGMETIILYTALMLKKRIVIYHPRVETLLEFTSCKTADRTVFPSKDVTGKCVINAGNGAFFGDSTTTIKKFRGALVRGWSARALPALTWHRKDWSILHPYVHLEDTELDSLRSCTGYVAGFVDPEVINRSDLFDVFVNLPDNEINVAQHAKEAMVMGKLHKEIGHLIVQSAEDTDRTDAQVIKDISVKTKEILSNLMSLAEEADDAKLTLDTLKRRHLPPATENFLFHLAAAEQLLKI